MSTETVGEARILVIEDESDLAKLLSLHLADQGYRVETRGDGPGGLEAAASGEFQLVVLDIMLPGMNGFNVCREIRRKNTQLPILMLTSKTEELDKVLGLELGADDYMTKPFSIRELVARVKALLRRSDLGGKDAGSEEDSVLQRGELCIDTRRRRVTIGTRAIELTTREFDLLLLFARNPGTAFSRQELLDKVWGYQYGGYSHTVNSHINRIRNKIEEDPAKPVWIETVWGLGYRFREEDA